MSMRCAVCAISHTHQETDEHGVERSRRFVGFDAIYCRGAKDLDPDTVYDSRSPIVCECCRDALAAVVFEVAQRCAGRLALLREQALAIDRQIEQGIEKLNKQREYSKQQLTAALTNELRKELEL